MDLATTSILELRNLIGRRVDFRGRRLQIVEVLAEGPALVLMEPGGARPIQATQFNQAGRRAPDTWTVPLRGPDGAPHPLLSELTLLSAQAAGPDRP